MDEKLNKILEELATIRADLHDSRRRQARTEAILRKFVQVWLKNNPALPIEEQEAATLQTRKRYNQFMLVVAEDLATGRLGGDLLEEIKAETETEDSTN